MIPLFLCIVPNTVGRKFKVTFLLILWLKCRLFIDYGVRIIFEVLDFSFNIFALARMRVCKHKTKKTSSKRDEQSTNKSQYSRKCDP